MTVPLARGRRALVLLIMVTGAAVLALELLASRIMTPYFGVSLYIWSSILATTLAFLALGYAWGGRLSRRAGQVAYFYLLSPALSAAAITGVCFVYPVVLPELVNLGLVLGTLVACLLLLGPSLVLLAAMNPLLVAILGESKDEAGGLAGRVFFLSTVGSVLGVAVTAFVLIPSLTNFSSMLAIALFLCAATSLALWRAAPAVRGGVWPLGVTLAATVVAAGALLAAKQQYLETVASGPRLPYEVRIEAEYTSAFGNIKVVQVQPRDGSARPFLAYLQDGLVQNRARTDGTSLSLYTHMLEILAYAYAPGFERALVLGLGAGIVPRNFARRGVAVSVVDINRASLEVAQRHFHFAPDGIDLHFEDARTFVRRCPQRYDVVVVDLFQGDYAPDHLFSVQFFRDVSRCLGESGVMVMNAFFDLESEAVNDLLRATLARAFDQLIEYRGPSRNGFVVATTAQRPIVRRSGTRRLPPSLRKSVRSTLREGRYLDVARLRDIEPITDERNIFGVVFARTQMTLRRRLVSQVPAWALLN